MFTVKFNTEGLIHGQFGKAERFGTGPGLKNFEKSGTNSG